MEPLYKVRLTLRELHTFVGNFVVHGVGNFEPNRTDAKRFQEDLTDFAIKVDSVIEAYGEYLESIGVVSGYEARVYFKDVLMSGLDGNALFCVLDGVERRIQEREESE